MKTLVTLAGIFFCNIAFSQSIWIEKVEKFDQGLNNDGGIISELRSDSSKCIGFAQASDTFTPDSNANYVALGFGGEIDLKFSHPIKNVDGMDLKVHETTFGTPACRRYPERIILFASQDNCNWYYCGTGCQDTEFDLGELNWAQYVKIIDVSPYGNFDPFGVCDGFDIDAVEGYVREVNLTPTLLIPGTAQHVVSFQQGLRKNGSPVSASRSNPENALGLPQGTEVVNFVSLGFGGQLILKFDFVVFNREGYDFQITETTYGNPQCEQYPESAFIEVSLDGENWEELGEICLDEMIEMDSVKCFQYIRITDRSPATQFTSSADGFDVDGVFTFTNCGQLQKVDFDDIISEDEVSDNHVVLSPNPFDDRIFIGNSEKMTVTIYNYVGVKIKEYRNVTNEVNTESLPAGVYYVEVLSPTVRSTQKLFKK